MDLHKLYFFEKCIYPLKFNTIQIVFTTQFFHYRTK